jgi:hypothetical protein
LSRPQVVAPVHAIPELRFEDQRLTSFSGLVIFQALFQRLRLKERLATAVAGARAAAYRPQNLVMMLVVHLLLGFRRLRERDYYRDDPLVQRVLGLQRLPDVSTWTRGLAEMTPNNIEGMRAVNRDLVLDRLREEKLPRVTIDFDGSVLSTGSTCFIGPGTSTTRAMPSRSSKPTSGSCARSSGFVRSRPGWTARSSLRTSPRSSSI